MERLLELWMFYSLRLWKLLEEVKAEESIDKLTSRMNEVGIDPWRYEMY